MTELSIDALITSQQRVRAFLPLPVPDATIDEILAVCARTPSWCNTQPWHVHVSNIETTEKWRSELAARVAHGIDAATDIEFPGAYVGEYGVRRRDTALRLYDAVGVARGDRAASARQTLKNFSFFGAPHVAIVTTTASLGTYGVLDCGLFVQSFLLAARRRGIGSIPQAALATQSPYFREQLDLDDDRQVVLGISFGYADTMDPANQFKTDRVGLDRVRTWV